MIEKIEKFKNRFKNKLYQNMKKSSVSPPLLETDKIIQIKIEKSMELICPLLKQNLIEDAYIVGSVAGGTAEFYSDVDINLINPSFEIHPLFPIFDLRPEIIERFSPNIKKIVDALKHMNVEFKYIKRKGNESWYQIYKDQLFHIMLTKDVKSIVKPNFHITNELCQWFL